MADTAEPRQRPFVLLVEDEPLIRMLAEEMLDLLGYVALEAGSAAEALAIVSQRVDHLHAMMIDLGLPDQPGETVIRRVRDLRPDLPVIVVTGADTVSAARRLDDYDGIAFLEKPYNFIDLESTVAGLALAR